MKVLAITGGGQGIGRAIALRFGRAGYAVSLADPAADAGREVAELLEQNGSRAFYMKADIARDADVARWTRETKRRLGCPDVLVNNAGIMVRKPVLELPVKDFDRVLGVNLRGTFLCSQAAARLMAKRGQGGAIINIASTRAFMSEPNTEGYTASKGGIVALTHGMAISLAEQRIRVNCISPGWIDTADWQFSGRSRKPKHSKADREQHPVGRVGTPEDIAEAALFLADSASFMTGQNITIDGGMTVKMIYEE